MKRRIENYLLKYLFNAITLEEIMSNDTSPARILLIDGLPLSVNEVRQLQAEIKAMEGFRIWHILSNTTKHRAEDRIFNKSVVLDDVRFGKAMLYNLSLQHSIMEAIRKKKL